MAEQDLEAVVVSMLAADRRVRSVRLVGSRARGTATWCSDWDFKVESGEFETLAAAMPGLVAALAPIAQQWDRLSDQACYMLILRGPAKVDFIFNQRATHRPPWTVDAATLEGMNMHFWDWALWLCSKVARGDQGLVSAELRKLFEHLLEPLGALSSPHSLGEAIASYRDALVRQETRLGVRVDRALENEVSIVLRRLGL